MEERDGRDEERKKDEKEKVYRKLYERKRDTEVKKGRVKLGKEGGGPGKGNWGEKGES